MTNSRNAVLYFRRETSLESNVRRTLSGAMFAQVTASYLMGCERDKSVCRHVTDLSNTSMRFNIPTLARRFLNFESITFLIINKSFIYNKFGTHIYFIVYLYIYKYITILYTYIQSKLKHME